MPDLLLQPPWCVPILPVIMPRKPPNYFPDGLATEPKRVEPLPAKVIPGHSTGTHVPPQQWRIVEIVGDKRWPVLVGGQEWRGSERDAGIEAQRLKVQQGGRFEAEPVDR
jgi:hypothetical protein